MSRMGELIKASAIFGSGMTTDGVDTTLPEGYLKVYGRNVTLGSSIRIIMRDNSNNVLMCSGTSVPSAASGYAKGCLFFKTDASTGVKGLYENVGTTSSCTFNLIGSITEAEIALAQGKVLIGDSGGLAAAQTMSGDATISAAGVVTLDDTMIKYDSTSLSNVNIKALRATPITLVAAPGATKIIEFLGGMAKLVAGANVLSETSDNLAIKYTNGSGAALSETIEATGFIDQAADTFTTIVPIINGIVASTAGVNQAIVLHNTGDGEFGGNAAADATMVVKIAYRVHTFA